MIRAPPCIMALIVFFIFMPMASAAAPVISYVTDYPDPALLGSNVTIRANVTDPDGDLDTVMVNFTYPMNETYEMTNITPSLFEFNFTPSDAKIFIYSIYANDTTGNQTLSEDYSIVVIIVDQAIISIEVSPSCGVGFSFYYVPEEVVREQTVFFLQINENIGNMKVNETSNMYLEYGENGSIFFGPHYDETIELDLMEEDLHYGLWNTYNDTPLGIYYWHGITEFVGKVLRGNYTVMYDWPDYNQTANCTEPEDTDYDGINETTCMYHIKRVCFNSYGREYKSNTTDSSSVTVPNQDTNYTAYHGLVNVSGDIYNAYTFRMNDCTEYCYACFTNDTSVTEDDCGYSTKWYGGVIESEIGNITVTEMASNGANATFSDTFKSCTDRYVLSFCEINTTIDKIVCTEKIQCNGSLEIIDDLEVVMEFGGEQEQPSPEPEPVPEPSPSPSPKPEPEPGPIKINIYPVEPEVSGMQEQLTPVEFVIENLGDSTVTNITVMPIVGEDWLAEPALVDSIGPGEKLNRTLFIQPSYLVEPSVYAIPVQALDSEGEVLDMTYFWFEVLPGKFLAKIKIVESPSEITLRSDSLEEIPILVQNVGKKPLTGVKAKLENIEDCIVNVTSPEIELDLEEEGGLDLKVKTRTGPRTCNAMLIVETNEDAYAFARIKINISPPSALLPGGIPLIPLLVVIFLALLVALVIIRRRGRYVGIIYPLVSVATLVLLVYIFLWYLGFVPMF